MNNKKPKCTDRLVTDGNKIYRLARKFSKIPKGLTEITYVKGEKVYDCDGYLLNKFTRFQGIEPRLNPTKTALAVNYVLTQGLYHAS